MRSIFGVMPCSSSRYTTVIENPPSQQQQKPKKSLPLKDKWVVVCKNKLIEFEEGGQDEALDAIRKLLDCHESTRAEKVEFMRGLEIETPVLGNNDGGDA